MGAIETGGLPVRLEVLSVEVRPFLNRASDGGARAVISLGEAATGAARVSDAYRWRSSAPDDDIEPSEPLLRAGPELVGWPPSGLALPAGSAAGCMPSG